MNKVVVAVGSNIEPKKNVLLAKDILTTEQILIAASEFIQTKPVGFQDQADFLNGAFYLSTEMDYNPFNQYLKAVEKRLKRVKGPIKSGPRTIDLDIIIWNCKVVDDDFYNKDYIKIPVSEILQKENIELI